MANNQSNRINYHKLFNILRNNDKKKIGRVKKREIRTSDESIINEILSANRSDEYKPGKTLYTIYNGITGEAIAIVDYSHRIFDTKGLYIGIVKNNTIIFFIILLFVMLLASIALMVSSLYVAEPIYMDLYVTSEGEVLNEDWNIFGKNPNSKVIYPGKSGYFKFNLVNENKDDFLCNIEFTDNNIHKIPVVYKLYSSYNGVVDYNWVTIDELNAYNITVKSNSELPLVLEWRWVNDGTNDINDTFVGNLDEVIYKINILITSQIK